MEQNSKNHVRYHPLFHFIGAPLSLISLIGALINLCCSINRGGNVWLALFILCSTMLLIITFFLTRIYSNKVQDRVIRMEENFRYYLLTGKKLDMNLSIGQIIALRFASDDEFVTLCERAVKEKLSPNEIKAAIKNWRADQYRV